MPRILHNVDCVPFIQIIIWLLFLFVYSQAVQEPLEITLDPRHSFDLWEYLLYGMALALTFESSLLSLPRTHTIARR